MLSHSETLSRNNTLFHALLDANPDWAFIVNSNVQIVDFNTQALDSFGGVHALLNQLVGDAICCKNAVESAKGCGTTTACRTCIQQNSVMEAIKQNLVYQSTTKILIDREDQVVHLDVQITAMPFRYEGQDFAYFTIENLTEKPSKRQLIPICSNCLKVKDNDVWLNVDKFLSAQPGINITHSICPDCKEKLYGEQLRRARRRAGKVKAPAK